MSYTLNYLVQTNGRVLGKSPQGLRNSDVFCVTKNNQIVDFLESQWVGPALQKCLENFNKEMEEAEHIKEKIFAISKFWISFIAIHPFTDGNGRTAKSIVRQSLKNAVGIDADPAILDEILLTEDFRKNIKKVYLALYSLVQT